MIADAHQKGIIDALAHFGIKSAGLKDLAGGAGRALFGQPGRAFVEGPKAFAPGGMLSHENVWWPKTEGLSGVSKMMPWLQRASTLSIPLALAHSAKADDNDGALANVLGHAGHIAGTAYGFPTLGILGAGAMGSAGEHLGRGIGHLLGSHSRNPQ
jgi:hypothetical protein